MKFAPEGYPFFAVFAGITAGAYLIGNAWIAVVPFLLFLFMLWFFRDPERVPPAGDDAFVAPADGKIIVIQSLREDRYLNTDVLMVSIFMSPVDVHVNRAPCDGTVEKVQHNPGKFLKAFLPEAAFENENIAMLLATRMGRIVVTQVAGAVARRCVCRVSPGASLKKGERYGMIKFSSRVDLYLPPDTIVAVQLGDKVTAGETVIGRRPNA
jgi:phosphatidylserine decarboxylase